MYVGLRCSAKSQQGVSAQLAAKICFMLRPFYALCDSPQRLSLLSTATPGDGFTHNLAMSLPVRHNVAQSRSRVLARDERLCGGFFPDSSATMRKKGATLWLKSAERALIPIVSADRAAAAREIPEPKSTLNH